MCVFTCIRMLLFACMLASVLIGITVSGRSNLCGCVLVHSCVHTCAHLHLCFGKKTGTPVLTGITMSGRESTVIFLLHTTSWNTSKKFSKHPKSCNRIHTFWGVIPIDSPCQKYIRSSLLKICNISPNEIIYQYSIHNEMNGHHPEIGL